MCEYPNQTGSGEHSLSHFTPIDEGPEERMNNTYGDEESSVENQTDDLTGSEDETIDNGSHKPSDEATEQKELEETKRYEMDQITSPGKVRTQTTRKYVLDVLYSPMVRL